MKNFSCKAGTLFKTKKWTTMVNTQEKNNKWQSATIIYPGQLVLCVDHEFTYDPFGLKVYFMFDQKIYCYSPWYIRDFDDYFEEVIPE